MPFDSTKPVENTPLDAAEMRDQFNALKALYDAQAVQIATLTTQVAALQAQLAAKATAIPAVALFDTNIPYHTPMEPGDFDPIYNKMNEVIAALQA